MIKNLKKTAVFLLSVVLLAGCGKTAEEPTPSSTPVVAEEKEVTQNFYTKYKDMKTRPVAVMIDNDNSDAWPHAGIEDAYLVYEITVEGAATRLMALFAETETKKIGPVRSSRHYFLDYALEHDAIYTHFGWSPRAQSDIPALGVNNINGLFDNAFWRENKYAGDYHSAFTSIEKIKAQIESKGYRTTREKAPLSYADENYKLEGEGAQTVSIPYAGFYGVKFEYDTESGTYQRYLNGQIHPLQNDGKINAMNIIIMKMPHSSLGDGSARINISDVGSGEGFFISGGEYIPISWSKSSRTAKTEFKDKNGNEILLNHGQTWIEIVSTAQTLAIE